MVPLFEMMELLNEKKICFFFSLYREFKVICLWLGFKMEAISAFSSNLWLSNFPPCIYFIGLVQALIQSIQVCFARKEKCSPKNVYIMRNYARFAILTINSGTQN